MNKDEEQELQYYGTFLRQRTNNIRRFMWAHYGIVNPIISTNDMDS